jgi:lipopolysaccharide export LptBFGC system permease protein LptF
MKIFGYSFLVLILPLIILVFLFTLVMFPKLRAKRKELRETILQRGRLLSKKEKTDLKATTITELETEMGTKDLRSANKELMSELKNGNLKDLFNPESKK